MFAIALVTADEGIITSGKEDRTDAIMHHDLNETMLLQIMNGGWRRKAAKLVGCCLLFVVPPYCEAQNLVPNPSFEVIDTCPYFPIMLGFQNDSKPRYWEMWHGSPDYLNACVDTMAGVPGNIFGFQHAYEGDAYIDMYTYGAGGEPEYREHVGVQLIQPLQEGWTYHLSFWVTAAEGTTTPPLPPGTAQNLFWASNNIGLLFTMSPNIWTSFEGPPFPPRNYAHLRAEQVVADTANWVLVSGTFIADSAYQYMVIGNFFNNDQTDTVHVTPGLSSGAYVYVDAVCVTTSPEGCDFGNSVPEIGSEPPWTIYPNPASGIVELITKGAPNTAWVVLDPLGRLVKEGRLEGDRARIDVSGWAVGTYIVAVEGNRRSFVRLAVVR